MNCKHALGWMSAYLDCELDASAQVQVELHLASCSRCEEALRQLQALHGETTRHLTHHVAPDALRKSILAGIARERQPTLVRTVAPRRWKWFSSIATGFAAAALAVAVTWQMAAPSSSDLLEQELVASHFRSLMPNHLADVASTDQHTVKPWFAGKLDFSPPVIDLAQSGYVLIGGRLDYLHQRPVAAIVYQYRKHLLNLYVWPAVGSDTPLSASSHQGFQLLNWRQGGMQYVAVSDMSRQQEDDFARTLRAALAAPQPEK